MKKILLIALGLVSPALGMVGVQAGSGGENVQNAKMEALQRRCEELSSNEIKYESVTGTVINAGFTPPPPCGYPAHPLPGAPRPKCEYAGQMAFSASLEDAVHDRTVYVITPYEDYSLLKEKDHYMTIGETYTFCARKLPTAVKSKAHYKIDDINTIVKI